MRLLSLKLLNFRPFLGETTISLADEPGKRITIIHGNNGGGKTTLLNAFTWALYGKHTGAYAAPHIHINRQAIAQAAHGERITAAVDLLFEHDGQRYEVRRECFVDKTGSIESLQESESVLWLKVNGEYVGKRTPEKPEDRLGQVLPESLYTYFFFDGERIDNIARAENREDMSRAIKTLLSVELLDRGIRHLHDSRRTLEKELSGIGDLETQTWIDQKQALADEQETLKDQRLNIASEIEASNRNIQTINARLADLEQVREIQEQRQALEDQQVGVERQMALSEDKLRRTLSAKGYVVFLTDAVSQFRQLAEDLHQRGQLPSRIKQGFVEELLEDQRCICGTSLPAGSTERDRVAGWLEKSGMGDVEEKIFYMKQEFGNLEQQQQDFWDEVEQERSSIRNLENQLTGINNRLNAISEKLQGNEDVNVSGLEKQREDAIAYRDGLVGDDRLAEDRIQQLGAEIKQLEKKIEEHEQRGEQQALLQRQIKATQQAIQCITDVRQRVDDKFRTVLEAKVRDIFQQVAVVPYLPKLNENYELFLVNRVGDEELVVPTSQGQNQVLSLSFIGSVIDRVRYWSKKHALLNLDASSYPLVMDSPFGNLDEIHRRQIALVIPELAEQLVVMATKTQWRGEVEQEMEPYIGKEYVLTYHTTKPNTRPDFIERYGVQYALVKPSAYDYEWTEIVEVLRGD
ncbi:MAG: AAA family ATPase [Leptolyngbya sp. RL_3_1]|nr:AAA family ATPase [Leptolyngbya sp. RL_3_1]